MTKVSARVSWSVLDQGLSSLTNFAAALVVARTLGLDSLGGYAVAFTTFTLAVELGRALGVEALAIRIGGVDESDGVDGAVSVAALVGVVAAAVAVPAGLVVGGPVGQALLSMSLFVIFAVVQDALRTSFIAVGRPGRAIVSDGAWVLVQVLSLVWLLRLPEPSAGAGVAAWGMAAAVAAVFTILVFDVRVRPALALRWLRTHVDLWPGLLGEALLRAGLFQVTILVVAAIVGAAEMGRLRAAQVLFGPASMAVLLAPQIGVPEAVRRHTAAGVRRVAVTTAAVLVGLTLATALVVLVLPDSLGEAVLAENWAGAKSLALPVAGMIAASGLVTGGFVGLRAHARVDLTLRLRAGSSPAVLAAGAGAAQLGGVGPAALAIAGARVAMGFVTWRLLWFQSRSRDPVEVKS